MTTNDPQKAERLRMLRVHGSKKKYFHDILGTNSRLDALQASILRVKLRHLDSWSEARRNHADYYRAKFAQHGLQGVATCPPAPAAKFHHVYNQFTIRSPFRDELLESLRQSGVPTEIYYPRCLHLQPAFAYRGYSEGKCPVAERASEEVLSLPVYPELADAQQDRIVGAIAEFSAAKTRQIE